MIEIFVKVLLYVAAGLVLASVMIWYLTSAYEAITGRSNIVIAPFSIADSADEKSRGRSEALAKMLHARLQNIEHDLSVSQKALLNDAQSGALGPGNSEPAESKAAVTSIVPQLFATQGVSLQTRLFEPADIKVAVGGVDVGGIVPWLQKLLIAQRTLEFTYYETPTSVVVSGTLQPLGLGDEGLRIEVPKEQGQPAKDTPHNNCYNFAGCRGLIA
jgi:hypothetical protein